MNDITTVNLSKYIEDSVITENTTLTAAEKKLSPVYIDHNEMQI